jgi:hypothetical protein
MRFACQSCGKAYNLPEEKIADKSNVKLKCRVCGAIVEVKKQGEVVAQILGEGDNMRSRLSEAPAPLGSDMLTSLSSDDDGDATHAIAVGDQILSEGSTGDDAAAALLGHVKSALGQRALPPLPPPSPTGFGPTPVPPPLDLPRADPLPPFQRPEASAPPLPPAFNSGSPPPPPLPSPLPGATLQNGSNGAAARFADAGRADMMAPPDEPLLSLPSQTGGLGSGARTSGPGPSLGLASSSLAQGVMSAAALSGMDSAGFGASLEVSHAPPASGDTTRKMLAALATGILIGFIIARLFF